MNEEVKGALKAYISKKYPNKPEYLTGLEGENSDKVCIEWITEMDEVSNEIVCEYRWYESTQVVVDMGGVFIGYSGYHMTGDNGMWDMGLEYDAGTFEIMEEKKEIREIIFYVPKK